MMVRVCDVCGENEAVQGDRPSVTRSVAMHPARARTDDQDLRITVELRSDRQVDVCTQCELIAIRVACRDFLLDEEKLAAVNCAIAHQAGKPENWKVHPPIPPTPSFHTRNRPGSFPFFPPRAPWPEKPEMTVEEYECLTGDLEQLVRETLEPTIEIERPAGILDRDCGCEGVTAELCMDIQRRERPALLFNECQCACHGSRHGGSAPTEGCSDE